MIRAGQAGLGRRLSRSFFARDPVTVARDLLGRVLVSGEVAVRLTEVEAYWGIDDPASHAFRGRTPRNSVMFGPAGHLYVYFVYGMHWCANLVTGDDGVSSAVLLRAGEVVGGRDVAASRRPGARRPDQLARGPAALTTVLGLTGADTGLDVCAPESHLRLHAGRRIPDDHIAVGPRVGVAAAADRPWRYWIRDNPSVTAYRAHQPRSRIAPTQR